MDECKHCGGSIKLHPCGPGQVWIHRRNGFALCSLDEDCTTWAEPLDNAPS